MDQEPYSCEHVVPVEHEPRHHLVIENEFVRALAVEIAPYERTLCHHHAFDYLLYVAGDADIISAARGEGPKRLSYRDGECELLPAGMVHVVENLGETAFRNVVVELLPGAGSLRRGDAPKVISGETSIAQRFSDNAAAILAVEMKAGVELKVSGPAIVASPYESPVELEELGKPAAKLNQFRDLRWLRPNEEGILRNGGGESGKVVIFQMGSSAGTASAT